jgi:hypothetical protein
MNLQEWMGEMNLMNAMNLFRVSGRKICFVSKIGYKTNLYLLKRAFLHSSAFIRFIWRVLKPAFNEPNEYRCISLLFKAFFVLGKKQELFESLR